MFFFSLSSKSVKTPQSRFVGYILANKIGWLIVWLFFAITSQRFWHQISRAYVVSAYRVTAFLALRFTSFGRKARPVGEILSVALSILSSRWASGRLVSCFKELCFCMCHSRSELNASAHSLLCASLNSSSLARTSIYASASFPRGFETQFEIRIVYEYNEHMAQLLALQLQQEILL